MYKGIGNTDTVEVNFFRQMLASVVDYIGAHFIRKQIIKIVN